MVADVMGTQAPSELLGIHLTWPFTVPPEIDQAVQTGSPLPSDLSADEQRACEQLAFFYTHDLGYAQEMSHRPQTIYALEDSPVGLAAWLIDHDTPSYKLIARVFDGQPEGLTRDDIVDNITLYWLTNTAVSSARIYWENKKYTIFAPKNVAIPVAVSAFPDEVLQTPRSWTERKREWRVCPECASWTGRSRRPAPGQARRSHRRARAACRRRAGRRGAGDSLASVRP
jgi:hypothetical protein